MIWPTVSATGHRLQHLPADAHNWVRDQIARVAGKLKAEHGTTVGISGMALGTDMWHAQAVLDAGLDLHAYVPFPQQPDRWPASARRVWQRLIDQAAIVKYTADHYDVKYLHQRNDEMRRDSDAIVAVLDPAKRDGGTYSAVEKATAAGMPIVHIDPVARTVTLRNQPADINRTS